MGRPQPQFSLDSLRSQFKVMRECPVCTTVFENEHIKTVETTEGSQILHTTCSACQNSLIFFIGSTQLGLGLIGMMSDLTYEDIIRFRPKEAISEDTIIECYQALMHPAFSRSLTMIMN